MQYWKRETSPTQNIWKSDDESSHTSATQSIHAPSKVTPSLPFVSSFTIPAHDPYNTILIIHGLSLTDP